MRALGPILLASVVLAGQVQAAPVRDQQAREREARALFAVGSYQKALELYGQLFADTLHPTYLRNIGRCQQLMGEADKAITSFREYLRKAKDLSAQERQEVDGFIAEMSELQARRQRAEAGGPRAHLERGARLYANGRYAEALEAFQTAYALTPSPLIFWNVALCQMHLGQNEAALRLFRRFVAERPDHPNRAKAQQYITRLEEITRQRQPSRASAP
jgi:tetratricopeptide (TPR) repeat protein